MANYHYPFFSGVWVSSTELGEDFNIYMESFGHNFLSIAVVANFMKEIHEYHFFVEELRVKVNFIFLQLGH